MVASLSIAKQESLAQDKFSRNGVSKVLHIVAKNIAFILHVSSTVNLNTSPLTARLYYDFDAEDDKKEVEALKATPLEYTAHVNEAGDKADVEVKLNVLSSQHEGAFFRISLSTAADNKSNNKQQSLITWTNPIKVISKRNQVRKMLMRNEIAVEQISQPELKTPLPKRISNEEITDQLHLIQRQQEEQTKLIRQLLGGGNNNNNNSSTSVLNATSNLPLSPVLSIPDPADTDFESAFAAFLKSFQRLPEEHKASKVQKVLGAMTPSDSHSLAYFCDLYCNSAEGSLPVASAYPVANGGGYNDDSSPNHIDYNLSPQSMIDFLSSSPDGYTGEPVSDDVDFGLNNNFDAILSSDNHVTPIEQL